MKGGDVGVSRHLGMRGEFSLLESVTSRTLLVSMYTFDGIVFFGTLERRGIYSAIDLPV